MQDCDVIVVGLGPTGAALTGLLAKRGVRVAAFDRLPDLYPLPRAIGFDHETMRIVQELGFSERTIPFTAEYRPSEYLGVDGRLIKRLDMAPPPHRLGWAPNYVFDQPAFEHALRARVAELPDARLSVSTEIMSFEQTDQAVIARIRGQDGRVASVQGRYLVACDGGSSPVRKKLGIELEDLGFDEPWLVVDAMVNDAKLAQLPQTQVQYCEPGRPCTFVVGPGNHRRWEIMLLPGDSLSENFPEEQLWPLLSRWMKPGEGELRRAAAYRFHGLITKQWRAGRILLAGDAAHMTPPFMAQGMVQGLRDAQNLAWKLARVVNGESPDSLLDSYGIERRPHVETTTREAIALGRVICERDADRARARDRAMLGENNGTIRTTIRQTMVPGLSAGLIAPGTPGAGQTCPQPIVRASNDRMQRLDDLTGARFRVISTASLSLDETATLSAAIQQLDGCVVTITADGNPDPSTAVHEVEAVLGPWLGDLDRQFVIVRPDHYVYGTASSVQEVLSMISRLHSRLA